MMCCAVHARRNDEGERMGRNGDVDKMMRVRKRERKK